MGSKTRMRISGEQRHRRLVRTTRTTPPLLSLIGMIIILVALSYLCDESQHSLLPTVSAAYSRAFRSSRFPSFGASEVIQRGGGGGSKDNPPAKKEDTKEEANDGDDKEDDNEEEEEEGDAAQETAVQGLKEIDEQPQPPATPKPKKSKKMSVLTSPFRMNEAVQEQASSTDKVTSSSVLSGGAMVKTNPEKVQHKPLDTSRVAPLSSRLITETWQATEAEETEEPTQQVDEVLEDQDDPDEEDLSATEELEEEESDADSEMEDTILKIAIDDETEDTFEQEFQAIEEDTASDSSTSTSTSTPQQEESYFESVVVPNYVSSGLWLPIDNLLTLGLSTFYPSIRLSRRFRLTRKLTARVTGLHGVLSGKPRAEVSGSEEAEESFLKEESDVDAQVEDAILEIAIDDKTESTELETEKQFEQELKVVEEASSISESLPTQEEESYFESVVVPDYVSSGLWVPIDNLLTLGLSTFYPSIRLSRSLRSARKVTARITGLHGVFSGKPRAARVMATLEQVPEDEGDMKDIRNRIAAIDRARKGVERARKADQRVKKRRRFFGGRRLDEGVSEGEEATVELSVIPKVSKEEELEIKRIQEEEERQRQEQIRIAQQEEKRRMERVQQIDRLMSEGQVQLLQLATEKDVLQRRPNPLWNYTTQTVEPPKVETRVEEGEESEEEGVDIGIKASRKFNFPPEDLVDEYLDMIFATRRITKMNHTFLWKDSEMSDDDDEEYIGDDLLTPSADAHKLYKDNDSRKKKKEKVRRKNGGGGSWFLRQSLGSGPSLGEKLGETVETAAYKAVSGAVMGFLAKLLSSLHGINVMKHSDIRLVLEQAPYLPPVGEGVIPGGSDRYAQDAIRSIIRKKARRTKKRSKRPPSEDSFVQRDAVTEMLLSHCQISAPLLKLFPLAWQRALLGNILTLVTAVMSDFFEGLQVQILGHQLSCSFKPITEEDMINHFGLGGGGFNHRRARPEEFEAAVRATAEDLSEELKFLDRWHERALGSGVLRSQIANLIARIVLTLADEVLSGARIDMWAAQAGGPRMVAGLEYRTKQNSMSAI